MRVGSEAESRRSSTARIPSWAAVVRSCRGAASASVVKGRSWYSAAYASRSCAPLPPI